ncbi:MAG TPA: bifunctional alpha,alpha-trehalose-phosphate synthase (UDP-forming)/trehalose-phosphatase [Candidatus Saccharimonadales bacterium]|nr:bifunctional alpha,alpha-trehalose-phosphate synthase (UDP-forming)/trehalose-phosphatase [Candidatus Saccharimonadales bacterium]
MAQVIIVSNRLPVSVKKVGDELEFSASLGGLATGLSSYVQNRKNKWIGWPGIPSEELTERDKTTISYELAKSNCYPVFLSKKQIDAFYNGYSNRILWPLFHNLSPHLEDYDREWRAYRQVNHLFAEAVLSLIETTSTIWVHDYQLLLLPEMLRAERPNDHIGFFLHIPFPDVDTFASLKTGKKLLHGMLGADLVGFHTTSYADNFLETSQQLDHHVVLRDQVLLDRRVVRVTDFPMGIDYDKYAQAARTKEVKKAIHTYKRKYRGRKVIAAVDRLDPTKGLVERLEAYREFLETNPQFHGKVVLAMIAAPSRTDIPEYKELSLHIETLVKQINNTIGWPKWQPIDYMNTAHPFEEVAALYQVADIAFIAPLRDGMNLVAKEYVAAKRGRGVLILSETAGAAQELTEALLVDPARRNTVVAALYQAVNMPKHELKRRLHAMQKQLEGRTVHTWANAFLKALERPTYTSTIHRTQTLTPDRQKALVASYRQASSRLLLLDYDGVLVALATHYKQAAPSKGVVQTIKKLAADPANEVVIVSGRTRTNLDDWFDSIPVNLVAEHGAFTKDVRGTWHKTRGHSTAWKERIRPIMEKYARRTPGAVIEEKSNSLVWHYRQSPPYEAQKYTVILRRVLQTIVRDYDLAVYSGNKILEVKDPSTSKAETVQRWMKHPHDFILTIGDDYTDEDMFAALPDSAYTIKVGRGRTHAKYRLKSSSEVQALLKRLVK